MARHIQASERSQLEIRMKLAGLEGDVRVAGEVAKPPKVGAIDNEVSGHLKRAIPSDYDYDPKALKPLAKMLWALSVSLGHVMTAHQQFTKLKSSSISPDGLIGGRGYVMSVKDIRTALYDASEAISAVSDTIHDELHAPHWKPKLGAMEKGDVESVERLVGDAERIMEDPEGETSDDEPEDIDKAEKSGPRADLDDDDDDDDSGSEMPDGDDYPDAVAQPARDMQTKQASYRRGLPAVHVLKRWASSLPVETLPGPRVNHLDRGDVDQTGPFGSYNSEEPRSMHDNWSKNDGGRGGEYDYVSDWDNDLSERSATSMVPDSNTEPTPTQGYDFGIGYGNGNDAHGQGAGGYGTVDTDGKGVYGPHAEMPDDPGAGGHDDENDTTPSIEISVSRSSMPRTAAAYEMKDLRSIIVRGREYKVRYVTRDHGDPIAVIDVSGEEFDGEPGPFGGDYGDEYRLPRDFVVPQNGRARLAAADPWKVDAVAELPNDGEPPVARSDYFPGDKGSNLVNAISGDSELPGEPRNPYEFAKDVHPGLGYGYEQGAQPYIKWDSETHNMRPDYVYQREVQGPYVKQEG